MGLIQEKRFFFLYNQSMGFDSESKTDLGVRHYLGDGPGPFENCHEQSRSHRTLNRWLKCLPIHQ